MYTCKKKLKARKQYMKKSILQNKKVELRCTSLKK